MVIRGFRKTGAFEETCGTRLNDQTRCEVTALAASAWLNLRLQLVAQFVVTGVVVTSLIGCVLGYIDVSVMVSFAYSSFCVFSGDLQY